MKWSQLVLISVTATFISVGSAAIHSSASAEAENLQPAESSTAFVDNESDAPAPIPGGIYLIVGGVIAGVLLIRPHVIRVRKDEVGIVSKKYGRSLPANRQIAVNGEIGEQIDTLAPGRHYLFPFWMYKVKKAKAIQIDTDEIGIVKARDGASLPPGKMFGKLVECFDFQNGRGFIKNGGQRGHQLGILRNGIYRINPKLFTVEIGSIVHIREDEVGLVEAKDGRSLPSGTSFGDAVECSNFEDAEAFINNGGYRGKQLKVLTTGKYAINTELFKVRNVPEIKIPSGEIGLVLAQDGAVRESGQILSKTVECNNFQDGSAFIRNGGQRGKQREILTSGTYQINTDLFTVITSKNAKQHDLKPEQLKVYTVESDKIGIVTTFDGKPLLPGNIAAPIADGQNKFQNAQQFIDVGGYRGLQEEILEEGSWNLNPWFVKVKQIPLTKIKAGTVGVVISNIGQNVEQIKDGNLDRSQSQFNIVPRGYKGIEEIPLEAGKYPLNTRVKSVEIVPTHDITLDWTNRDKEVTEYDSNLKTLELHSQDGFAFELEVTQVINIAAINAPKLISRVGSPTANNIDKIVDKIMDSDDAVKYSSIQNLVIRVIEPMVGNYFRDAAQKFNALDFLKKRDEIQQEASEHIKMALHAYGVQAVNTLINEISLPEELEKFIRDITIYDSDRKALKEKQKAEEERRALVALEEATKYQSALTKAKIDTEIAKEASKAQKIVHNTEREKIEIEAFREKLVMQLGVNKLREEMQIEATRQELEKQLDLTVFQETLNTLSPELYVKMETDKMWSDAFAKFKFTAPQTLINGGGNSDSEGVNALYSGEFQMQLLAMMTDRLNNRQSNNSQPDILPSDNSQPELLNPEDAIDTLFDGIEGD